MSNRRPHAHRRPLTASRTLAALVVAGALAACGSSDDDSSASTATTAAAGDGATSVTSDPATTAAETTVVDSVAPTTPATSPDTTASPTTPATEATVPSVPRGPFGAIDGNGDALIVAGDVATPVYDGADPDDAAPEEGEAVFVDGVAVAGDGTFAVVSICCEPVPGNLVAVAPGEDPIGLGFGHLATLTADESMVWTAYGPVNVGANDGTVAAELATFAPEDGTVIDLAVVRRAAAPAEEVLVLVARADGTWLHRVSLGGGDMMTSVQVSTATWEAPVLPMLAGWREDAFYVLEKDDNELLAFDADTLEPTTVDITDEADWQSAWFTPGGSILVSDLRQLEVDGVMVPGEYLWAR